MLKDHFSGSYTQLKLFDFEAQRRISRHFNLQIKLFFIQACTGFVSAVFFPQINKLKWLLTLFMCLVCLCSWISKRTFNTALFYFISVCHYCVCFCSESKPVCVCLHHQIIVSYPPTKLLSSEEQDLVWKFRYYLTTQEKVGVFVIFCSTIPKSTRYILSCSMLPPLTAGPDKVPQVCELGFAPGGQAGSGAAGEVEADGCGGLPGAAVLPVHQPHSQTLRCGAPAAGRWWGRRRRIERGQEECILVWVDDHEDGDSVCVYVFSLLFQSSLRIIIISYLMINPSFKSKISSRSRTCWCISSSWSRRSSTRTSVIFREAWSQAARETARDFQMTPHWTGQ